VAGHGARAVGTAVELEVLGGGACWGRAAVAAALGGVAVGHGADYCVCER
jgi:hypothetical protein